MAERKATVERNTLETQITVTVNLDGSGQTQFETGVPFLEHMLDQIARHGMVDLAIKAVGDLHIDDHHTVEDIGITLGQAFAKAAGDKKGILRYGHAYVPLDEALSRVVIDFSGRPGLEYHIPFTRAAVGGFDVDLFHGERQDVSYPLSDSLFVGSKLGPLGGDDTVEIDHAVSCSRHLLMSQSQHLGGVTPAVFCGCVGK